MANRIDWFIFFKKMESTTQRIIEKISQNEQEVTALFNGTIWNFLHEKGSYCFLVISGFFIEIE